MGKLTVARYDSLLLLALVTHRNLEMMQFDVRTAFLYGEIDEDIYMEIPEGLKDCKTTSDKVCKLKKSLYGLKQVPRCWNRKFHNALKIFQFKESNADKCIYRAVVNENTVYLALFVDDGIVVSSSKRSINMVINE